MSHDETAARSDLYTDRQDTNHGENGGSGSPRPSSSESDVASQQLGDRLILLGTAGGPRPNKFRHSPAQVILVNGTPYVIDCGYGVARQMVLADIPLNTLRHVFITHHHLDHNADYGTLLLMAWVSGLNKRVDTWGPPPLTEMTELAFRYNAYDINIRMEDEGRVSPAPLVHAHEFDEPGLVMEDDNVRVTAALVDHPPVSPSFAYRFDTPYRSIVISGDTTPQKSLVELAQGADVLVHEALYEPGVRRLADRVPNAATLYEHLLNSHTTAEDTGKIASDAGVKILVLSHFVPTDDPSITDDMWREAASKHFDGEVLVGRDLMTM